MRTEFLLVIEKIRCSSKAKRHHVDKKKTYWLSLDLKIYSTRKGILKWGETVLELFAETRTNLDYKALIQSSSL